MNKERELLRRALEVLDEKVIGYEITKGAIRTYLSTPSDDAEEPVKCKRCNGTGAIKTGEIDCYPDGTPYMNGPVICVEDCPDCHPPKPAESDAEIIETLKAENFALASGQCTEGGPWGDKGGTPYCKYAKRKPMTEEEILELYNQCEEETSVHSTIFHFDKFARAIEARGIVLRPLNKKQIEKAFEDTGYAKGDSRGACFVAGIRFAEKHHGIGGDDE